jgi:hypothetical protein
MAANTPLFLYSGSVAAGLTAIFGSGVVLTGYGGTV